MSELDMEYEEVVVPVGLDAFFSIQSDLYQMLLNRIETHFSDWELKPHVVIIRINGTEHHMALDQPEKIHFFINGYVAAKEESLATVKIDA